MSPWFRLALALALTAVFAAPAAAQRRTHDMDMDEVKSNAPFRPGLGDLMTALVQPRHTKLGLAGQAQNWDYAAYELDELRETFDLVGKLILKHGGLAIPPAIASTVKQPMDAVDTA